MAGKILSGANSTNTIIASHTEDQDRTALTLGVLNDGGSLVGLDIEFLFHECFGIQAGIGIFSFGFGANVFFIEGRNLLFDPFFSLIGYLYIFL